MSTFLDDVLSASSSVIRPMIAAGTDDPAILGNGSIIMVTKVHDAVRTARTLVDGLPVFNFASWAPNTAVPALQTQSLHLGNGVFTETFTVPGGTLTSTLCALRQHAGCALQTMSIPAGQYKHAPTIPDELVLDGGDHTYVNSKGVAVPCLRLRAHARCDPSVRYAYLGAYLKADNVSWLGLDRKPFAPENSFQVTGTGLINVLHCVAYGPDADTVVTRTAVAALVGANNSGSLLHAGNTFRWASVWRAGITVVPKVPGNADVAGVNLAIKAAQYRVLSTRRDAGRVSLFSQGPAWIPCPAAAIVATVPDYSKAAAVESLKRALESQTATDPAAPRLDVLAFAILDAWNVFRVTNDRSWLRSASPYVYSAANALAQRVESAGLDAIDPVTLEVPLTSVGTVTTALGEIVQDHGLATHLVRQSLSAATQMSYDLRDVPPDAWLSAYNQLVVPRDGTVIRYSAGNATGPQNDQALAHHPYVFAVPSASIVPSTLLRSGRTAAQSAVADADATLRLGSIAVLASSSPLVTGATNTAIASAYAYLNAEIAAMSPLWRTMSPDFLTDVATSAEFLSTVAFGFARARIYGVVDRDGVHVQRAQLAAEAIALLPTTWAGVRITTVSVGVSAPVVRSVANTTS
jgi:hypothetical protein